MSYLRDPDRMIRGVGAIAARDAGSTGRLRARLRQARGFASRDARMAKLTLGPRPLGVISATGTPTQSPRQPTGGQRYPEGPSYQPPALPDTSGYRPRPPVTPPSSTSPKISPWTPGLRFPKSASGSGVSTGLPGDAGGHPDSGVTPVTVVDQPPSDGAGGGLVTGGGTTGGGSSSGGGGGSSGVTPTSPDQPTFTTPTSMDPLPDAGSSTTQNLLMVGAGIGILYLLFRND